MKSERGVSLTTLVAYISVFMIIIGIVTTVSSHFYENLDTVKKPSKYISEFNKFAMFFVADIKANDSYKTISSSSLELKDGTIYEYKDGNIYRNDKIISKSLVSFSFTNSEYTENDFKKTIINVNAVYGEGENTLERNVDFVLKYW